MFGGFENIFHVYLMRGFQKMEEIEFSRWLFEGRLRQGKNVLPDGLNWLCYFAGNSNNHRENSISFIFLESSHQVDMKNFVKSSKHFFGYFNTLETHSVLTVHAMGNWEKINKPYICTAKIISKTYVHCTYVVWWCQVSGKNVII